MISTWYIYKDLTVKSRSFENGRFQDETGGRELLSQNGSVPSRQSWNIRMFKVTKGLASPLLSEITNVRSKLSYEVKKCSRSVLVLHGERIKLSRKAGQVKNLIKGWSERRRAEVVVRKKVSVSNYVREKKGK